MKTHSSPASVAVAVSGGADSLFTLIRLQESGVPVMALHGIFLDAGQSPEKKTADAAMRERLAATCQQLGVALHILDCTKLFLQHVIRPFVASYARGHTPNPCALCNASIKFGLLLEKAHELGATHLATGHYAQLVTDAANTASQDEAHKTQPFFPALLQGRDQRKDQSYFLSLVPREQLAAALFPLGEWQKKDVVETLSRRGIPVPQPGESQDVCFVPDDAYRDFLPAMAKKFGIRLAGTGSMLLQDGTRVGTHKGLWQYTEGQRKGLGIGWKEPLHVLGKEQQGNILRLGPRVAMQVAGCQCETMNILLPPSQWPAVVYAKTRYREQPKAAHITFADPNDLDATSTTPGITSGITPNITSGAVCVRFLEPDTAIAPGQVAAVYIPVENAEPSAPHQLASDCLRLVAGGVITSIMSE